MSEVKRTCESRMKENFTYGLLRGMEIVHTSIVFIPTLRSLSVSFGVDHNSGVEYSELYGFALAQCNVISKFED